MPKDTPKPPWRHWGRTESAKTPPVQVRFKAASGEVWTVWDATFSNYKHHRRAHCDPSAKERVFVNAAGVKRAYTFKRNESRVLEHEELERQLGEAGYVTEMPNNSYRTPR